MDAASLERRNDVRVHRIPANPTKKLCLHLSVRGVAWHGVALSVFTCARVLCMWTRAHVCVHACSDTHRTQGLEPMPTTCAWATAWATDWGVKTAIPQVAQGLGVATRARRGTGRRLDTA